MSQDFKTVLVKDSRLMVTDELFYAIRKGGQNNTVYPLLLGGKSDIVIYC